MDWRPCGIAPAALWQLWEGNPDRKNRISKNPRLPANRGFFVVEMNLCRLRWRPVRKDNMSARCVRRKLPARFGPESRFELKPVAAAPYRLLQENHFERLKAELLAARLKEVWEPNLNSQMRPPPPSLNRYRLLSRFPRCQPRVMPTGRPALFACSV